MRELAGKTPIDQTRLTSVVRIGGVYPEILAEAEEWGADLIVIGSHRPAMSTYLLGSNARTVVRHAKCSVLVVRE
jgi:universal stress protein F